MTSDKSGKRTGDKSDGGQSDGQREPPERTSLFEQLLEYTGRITGSIVDVVKTGSAIPLMYTDNWLKDLYMKSLDPERLRAMAEAGEFLHDARQVAGLNLQELAEALGLRDTELLEEVESGRATLPFDMILRIAALIARHDPIPFILKFVRTYNPALEQRLEEWGVTQLPKQYERERRFTNLLRQHDVLRELSDEEYERFIGYQEKAVEFTLQVMKEERGRKKSSKSRSRKKKQ